MPDTAEAMRKLQRWDEAAYGKVAEGPKLTRASVSYEYQDGLSGVGTLEYLMIYHSETSASFIGYEEFAGSVGQRSGSFVLEHRGTFASGVAQGTVQVVPSSGTGDLAAISGSGSFRSAEDNPANTTFHLDYDI